MKKFLFVFLIMTLYAQVVAAEGAMNNATTLINSQIFSTQAAQPLESLERTHYTNSAIMNLENKQNPHADIENKTSDIIPTEEKSGFKNFFKGFRVIW